MTNKELTHAREMGKKLLNMPGTNLTVYGAIGYVIQDLCDEVERLQKYESICTERDE